MTHFKGFIIIGACLVLAGCSGGGDVEVPTPNSSALGAETPVTGTPPGTGGGTPPVVTPPPVVPPSGPQPGDLVKDSTPDPEAQYPSLGQPLLPGPDPMVEPNSDYVVPIISITSQPNPFIPQTQGSIQVQAADNVGGRGLKSFLCSLDGGVFSACPSPITMDNLAEGLHTLEAKATDWDDNTSDAVSYTFYVDTTPPVVAITNAPPAATQDPSALITFDGSDVGSGFANYRCRVDNGPLKNCNTEESVQGLSEGSHTVEVSGVDAVGNLSAPTTHQWTVDYSGPEIQVINQPPAVVYTSAANAVVNFDVSDTYSPNNIATTCELNGQTMGCAAAQDITTSVSQPTDFTLVITATDVVGNTSSRSIEWRAVNETESQTSLVTVENIRPVDILFVVDNSGSMAFERSNLAERIDGMISVIDGLDWQIAITSTDATTEDEKSDGRFIELMGMPGQYILDSSMDVNTAQSVFGTTVEGFGGGSGREEGIYVSKRVIERYLAGDTPHASFFRPGADLSIVVLSDEDESSDGTDARISPQEFVNYVDATFNQEKNMVFHSIITRPGDSTCLADEGYNYGDIYDELSRLTGYGELGGAIIGSVCNQDYTSQLSDIGQSVKDLQNSIKLECEPHDANLDGLPEVVVQYRPDGNGTFAPYTAEMQVQGDRVIYDDLLPPGEYKADYQCKIN